MKKKSFVMVVLGLFMAASQLLASDSEFESRLFGFNVFVVNIAAAKNYVAPANLYIPSLGQQQKLPAVILQFGAQGDKDADYIVEIGEGLAERGFIVLTVDMAGRGSRAYTSPGPENFEELIKWYMDDYVRAVDYLLTLPQVDAGRIHFAGTSLGAITGIPFCAADQRIKTCTAIVGGGPSHSDLPENLDCVQMVSKIAPRATLLINGLYDLVIPYASATNIHERARFPVVKMWYPSGHYLRTIDKQDLYDRMGKFMREYGD